MNDFATYRWMDANKNLLRCDSCSGMDFSQNFGEKCDKILGCAPWYGDVDHPLPCQLYQKKPRAPTLEPCTSFSLTTNIITNCVVASCARAGRAHSINIVLQYTCANFIPQIIGFCWYLFWLWLHIKAQCRCVLNKTLRSYLSFGF